MESIIPHRPRDRIRLAAASLHLAAFAVHGATAWTAPTPPLPVIIDTVIGDAFVVATALADPRLQIVGITAAWGDTRTRTLLVRRLLAALGRTDIPVAEGPATPNATQFSQKQWAPRALPPRTR